MLVETVYITAIRDRDKVMRVLDRLAPRHRIYQIF